MPHSDNRLAAAACLILLLSWGQTEPKPVPAVCADTLCQTWFGAEALATPLTLADSDAVIREVIRNGKTAGWIFRTDQTPPQAKGKRGEIVLVVGLGADARIKGVHVLSHKEDAAYFGRLKPEFFAQFLNRRADDDPARIDTVTKATLSSRAIIREVTEGTRHLITRPEITAKLTAQPTCEWAGTAARAHP